MTAQGLQFSKGVSHSGVCGIVREVVMKHFGSPAGKIIGAVVGGISGNFVGAALGFLLMGLASSSLYAEPPVIAKALFYLCRLTGPVGGGLLGFYVGRKPVVGWWSLGTALGLGIVSFVVGIAIWPHDLGPIMVMFFIAPLGFAVGAVLGMCIGLVIQWGSDPTSK